jgi:hypothetical protein
MYRETTDKEKKEFMELYHKTKKEKKEYFTFLGQKFNVKFVEHLILITGGNPTNIKDDE